MEPLPVKDSSQKENAIIIGLADLCHKYYKAKPTLLNLDVNVIDEETIRSNDWQNSRCIPEAIYVKKAQSKKGLEPMLLGYNYVKVDKAGTSALFVLKNKAQFYKK